MNTFSELNLTSVLAANLARNNFQQPTPVQAKAIPPALEGRDVVATAQTGTGKTLAFVLPLIQSLSSQGRVTGVRAVVLSPTRELAIQIHETFLKLAGGTGIRAAVVVGGLGEGPQIKQIKSGAQVIIGTPGRLQDFLDRRLVNLSQAGVFILDEADRMLDMGFLPAIEEIVSYLPEKRQTLFFSATIEASAAKLIQKYLHNPVRIAIGSITKPHENVELHVYEVEQDRKLGLLNLMLREEKGAFLVFARTKHGADKLAKKLHLQGVKATAIHGGRTQNQRNQALRGFQQGHYRVLVATDVAARGIHVDGIAHVVNYDLPQAPEDFIHRVGRTGRAGGRGVASTFGTRQERSEIRRIERTLKVTFERREVAREVEREDRHLAPVIELPVMPVDGPAKFAHHGAHAPAVKRTFGKFRPRKRA
jgi:ATP-dependent RNA helicase RhlE